MAPAAFALQSAAGHVSPAPRRTAAARRRVRDVTRRGLRIANGQDPDTMPDKFTPKEDQRMKWPRNEEAVEWAESAKKKARKGMNLLLADARYNGMDKNFTQTPAGTSNAAAAMPVTDEEKPAGKAPVEGSPMPLHLVANDTE